MAVATDNINTDIPFRAGNARLTNLSGRLLGGPCGPCRTDRVLGGGHHPCSS